MPNSSLTPQLVPLMQALKGPVPDLKAMEESDCLLRQFDNGKDKVKPRLAGIAKRGPSVPAP